MVPQGSRVGTVTCLSNEHSGPQVFVRLTPDYEMYSNWTNVHQADQKSLAYIT